MFLTALAVGLHVASRAAPERLREEAARVLAGALGAPVEIGQVRLALRGGILLRGETVSTWRDGSAPALRVARVEARLDLWSLLGGELKLKRLSLEGARLSVARSRQGDWSPPPLARPKTPEAREARSHPGELLRPLIVLEGAVRRLLKAPGAAEVLEVHDSRVDLTDWLGRAAPGGGSPPFALSLRGVEGRLAFPRLQGGAQLSLRGRLFQGEQLRGELEWSGQRGRSGPLRTSLAARSLALGSLSPWLALPGGAGGPAGELTGSLAFETAEPGSGRLELDLLASDLEVPLPVRPDPAAPPASLAPPPGPLRAESAAARAVLVLTPDRVQLEHARFSSGSLTLELEGLLARPLSMASSARLAVAFRDVELARALEFLGWLPAVAPAEPSRERQRVEAGRLETLTARGTAPLIGWRQFFSGRTAKLPEGLAVDAELTDGRVRVGERDLLEGLRAELHWSGDRVQVREGRATLNGSPMPALDLDLEGVSNLFATDPARRALRSGGEPLEGLRAFWQLLGRREAPAAAGMDTSVWLEIGSLEHPMFLWPVEDVWAEIEPREGGVHIAATKGTWAGAPVHGDADWIFEPQERVSVRVVAGPPEPGAAPLDQGFGWAHGRFTVGALERRAWRQKRARGTFSAEGSTVHLGEVEIELSPGGALRASGALDLGVPELVPFRLELDLEDGDAGALAELAGLEAGAATGRVALSGAVEGRLQAGASLFGSLSGRLALAASEGTLRRSIPPVIAAALASDTFNPFTSRESVRYHRIESQLEFRQGRLHTDSFALDGPDLRLLAAGDVDLGHRPHPIRGEVAVFLFRVIDRALEKIPLVNALLLGEDESILAAYYELSGTWEEPEAGLVPLRTMASGPASLVLERVPSMLRRGIEALGSLLGGGRDRDPGDVRKDPPARLRGDS